MNSLVALVIGLLFISTGLAYDYDDCGQMSQEIRGINGGGRSGHGMWPWHVGIQKIQKGREWKTICSGTLIAPQWVLTSASCFSVKRPKNSFPTFHDDTKQVKKYKVVAGDYDINRYEPTEQKSTPLEILVLPHDLQVLAQVDILGAIALIKLDRNLTLGPFVRTVCLPNKDGFAKEGALGFAAGWGLTGIGSQSLALHHSAYQIQNSDMCNRTTHLTFNPKYLFCVRVKGHRNKCKSDIGAGMVRNVLINGRHRWVIIGVFRWGDGCAITGKYGYYTRLLVPFIKWITMQTVSAASCQVPGSPPHGFRYPIPAKQNGRNVTFMWYLCMRNYTSNHKSLFFVIPCNKPWTGVAPKCSAPCSDPGIPRNGFRHDHSFLHNKTVRFSCRKVGWKMIGVDTIRCNDGQWNYNEPICVPMASCSDPGIPRGTHRLGQSFRHNNVVWFICYKGWKMEGVPIIRCNNGWWDHNAPRCLDTQVSAHYSFVPKQNLQTFISFFGIASCSDPGIPIGGYRHNHSFHHKDQVKFSCSKTWRMIGADTIKCYNGQWDHKAPNCFTQPRPLGCFSDLYAKPQPLPKLIGYFSGNHESPSKGYNQTILRCAWKAQQMNFSTFGVQSNGACWSGSESDDTYSRDGKSSNCHDGVGGSGSIFVYTFTDQKSGGGCFPANATLRLKNGRNATMKHLKLGDEVQTLDISTNEVVYTEVIAFLHRDQGQGLYRVIEVEDGNNIFLSLKHLIFAGKTKDTMNMIYAEKVEPEDIVLSGSKTSRVISVKTVNDSGLYAPLTRHGTILVNGVYVSCYAQWGSHEVAHLAMAPLRLWYDVSKVARDVATAVGIGKPANGSQTDDSSKETSQGIHGYAKFLIMISKYLP